MSTNAQKKPRAALSTVHKGAQRADASKGKHPGAGGKTKSAPKQSGVLGKLFAPALFQSSENSIAQTGNSIASGVNGDKGLFPFVIEVYDPTNLS